MVLQTVRLKSDKMATENSTLPVSEEHLNSSVVEDTQNNSVPADGGKRIPQLRTIPAYRRRVRWTSPMKMQRWARKCGARPGEASPEEKAAGGEAAGNDLARVKSKEELLAIFAKMSRAAGAVPAPGCGRPSR